jgi:hypothetical protein
MGVSIETLQFLQQVLILLQGNQAAVSIVFKIGQTRIRKHKKEH